MIHNCCAFGTADLQQSLPHWFGCRFGAGAETAAGATAEAAALAAAKRKRSTGRENRLAKQHVAPMGKRKRGRWGGTCISQDPRFSLSGSRPQKIEYLL
jgi:hypothetical protein